MCPLLCAALTPELYIDEGVSRIYILRCGTYFIIWNIDKEPSMMEVPERPTPPPAHVVCVGERTLGRALYVPTQNLGLMRSLFSRLTAEQEFCG